jgi:integrase
MARKVKDAALDSAAARRVLKPRGKPYWRTIERGLHLGYRRLKGRAGTWWARHYLGAQTYEIEPIGIADDLSAVDGVVVLDFWQAISAARERMVTRAHEAAGITGPLTVQEAVESYLASLQADGRDVVDSRCRATAHIYPHLGDKPCSELKADHIRDWHRRLAKSLPRARTGAGKEQRHRKFAGDKEATRRRQSSANRVLTILRAALNHNFRNGKIASDHEWRMVKRFKGVDSARLRYLTVDEAQRLINAADPDFRPLVQGALQTGARFGQLAACTVSDFRSDANALRLRSRKGDGTERTYHATLTDEGTRFFQKLCAGRAGSELVFRNVGRIQRTIDREQRRRVKAGLPSEGITSDDPGDWRESEQLRPMVDTCRRAKINPPIGFHGLRHTWASLSVMAGVPLLVVAKNLGHADTRMVERHYGHLADSYIKDAIRAGAPQFGIVEPTNVATLRPARPIS